MKKNEMIKRLQEMESKAWDDLQMARWLWKDEYETEKELDHSERITYRRGEWGTINDILVEFEIPYEHSDESLDYSSEVYHYFIEKKAKAKAEEIA